MQARVHTPYRAQYASPIGWRAGEVVLLGARDTEWPDFAWITTELRAIATRHGGGRLVSMLEGGYSLEALAECAVAHVGALRD